MPKQTEKEGIRGWFQVLSAVFSLDQLCFHKHFFYSIDPFTKISNLKTTSWHVLDSSYLIAFHTGKNCKCSRNRRQFVKNYI